MKRLNVFNSVVFAFISILFVGCKSASSVVSNGTAIADDECVKLQEQAPERRDWGEGLRVESVDAVYDAIENAYAKFATRLETVVTAAFSRFSQEYTKGSVDETNKVVRVGDNTVLRKNFTSTATEQIVKNTAIIKTNRYQQEGGLFKAYACIEYRGTIEELAESIALKVKNQLSDEEKLKMNFDYQQYKKEIEEQLKKMKQE